MRLFNSIDAARADKSASSSKTGRSFFARASAAAWFASDCRLVPPSFTPLALAAARASPQREAIARFCNTEDFTLAGAPEAREFIDVAEKEGVREVITRRDSPFGDYSAAPKDQQPNPNNVIVPKKK